LRRQLLDCYLDGLAGFVPLERAGFMQHYYAYVYVRIMQALGAYGFRGFYERKTHFLQSVPYALKSLRWLVSIRRPGELFSSRPDSRGCSSMLPFSTFMGAACAFATALLYCPEATPRPTPGKNWLG